MVWEIVIGVVLVMGILTTVREIYLKWNHKKKATLTNEGSHDSNTSE
jgi:hypothetical protein